MNAALRWGMVDGIGLFMDGYARFNEGVFWVRESCAPVCFTDESVAHLERVSEFIFLVCPGVFLVSQSERLLQALFPPI
jgi:hypothetical protein